MRGLLAGALLLGALVGCSGEGISRQPLPAPKEALATTAVPPAALPPGAGFPVAGTLACEAGHRACSQGCCAWEPQALPEGPVKGAPQVVVTRDGATHLAYQRPEGECVVTRRASGGEWSSPLAVFQEDYQQVAALRLLARGSTAGLAVASSTFAWSWSVFLSKDGAPWQRFGALEQLQTNEVSLALEEPDVPWLVFRDVRTARAALARWTGSGWARVEGPSDTGISSTPWLLFGPGGAAARQLVQRSREKVLLSRWGESAGGAWAASSGVPVDGRVEGSPLSSVDAAGRVHVLVRTETGWNYLRHENGAWVREGLPAWEGAAGPGSFTVDAEGEPHWALCDAETDQPRYFWRGPQGWSAEGISGGEDCAGPVSVAVDADRTHLVFRSAREGGVLRYLSARR